MLKNGLPFPRSNPGCNACWFPRGQLSKYSYYAQFQATNGLTACLQNSWKFTSWLLRATEMSQLQHKETLLTLALTLCDTKSLVIYSYPIAWNRLRVLITSISHSGWGRKPKRGKRTRIEIRKCRPNSRETGISGWKVGSKVNSGAAQIRSKEKRGSQDLSNSRKIWDRNQPNSGQVY